MTTICNTPEGRKGQEGFSLVELAIVLIIIGLIVGGVLKGQDLIESARVNSINTQLNEIRVAASTFQNKYDALPGDISSDYETLIPGGTATTTAGGTRANGLIEGNRQAAAASEATLFWQHLRLAQLLGGIKVTNGKLESGDGLQARVSGQYTIKSEAQNDATAHWVMLGSGTTADNSGAVVSPTQARGIDVKSDDGKPYSGNVGARGTGTTCTTDATSTANYTTTAADLNKVNCSMVFRL